MNVPGMLSSWRPQRWFRPIPYRDWEMFIMRLLFALVVYSAFPKQVPFAGAKYEIGIARVMPLGWLSDQGTLDACRWVLIAALCLYVSGRLTALALPVMTFLTIAPATLANSQGAFHHHLQVLGLVVLGQWIWFTYRAFAPKEFLKPGHRTHVLNVFYSQQVIVATYLTTAVWKLWKTKFGWIRESKHFPVQLAKTRDAHYYNKLEHAGPESSGSIGGIDAWFARVTPHSSSLSFSPTRTCAARSSGRGSLLELFAFLALIGRRSRLLYGGMLILFHLIIGRVMNLNFEFNIFLLLIFFVNLPWLIVGIGSRIKRKRT